MNASDFITQAELGALEDAGALTVEQRIKILEVWLAKMLPLVFGYVTEDGATIPGVVRRLASLEKWVKVGVAIGTVLSFISTFGLAEPIKVALRHLLGGT